MADTKKEHYVPRCYLKNFLAEDGRIFVFDKKLMQQRKPQITEVAMENYFYDIDFSAVIDKVDQPKRDKLKADILGITGCSDWESVTTTYLNSKFLEKDFFMRVEGMFSEVLKRIIIKSYSGNKWVIEHCSAFSDEDKVLMSLFSAIQVLRTKHLRDRIEELTEKLPQVLYTKLSTLSEPQEGEQLVVRANNDYVKIQHSSMILNEDLVDELAETLYNHIWVMHINKTSKKFYTSDNPIGTIPHIYSQHSNNCGFASDGVEVVFPISPELLIGMYDKKMFSNVFRDRQFIEVTDTETIDDYNNLQVCNSSRCIFSSTDDFVMAKRICEQHSEIRDSKERLTIV